MDGLVCCRRFVCGVWPACASLCVCFCLGCLCLLCVLCSCLLGGWRRERTANLLRLFLPVLLFMHVNANQCKQTTEQQQQQLNNKRTTPFYNQNMLSIDIWLETVKSETRTSLEQVWMDVSISCTRMGTFASRPHNNVSTVAAVQSWEGKASRECSGLEVDPYRYAHVVRIEGSVADPCVFLLLLLLLHRPVGSVNTNRGNAKQ